MTLENGDPAPDFTLADADDADVSLSGLKGTAVVLYFYPRDDTSGCTLESMDFTAALPDFEAAGATVIGISADNVASHKRFRDKHALAVTLLSDPDRDAIEAYGVWREKRMYGRVYMGIERSTFLVDRHGRIAEMWRKVRVPGHIDKVLEAVQGLPA